MENRTRTKKITGFSLAFSAAAAATAATAALTTKKKNDNLGIHARSAKASGLLLMSAPFLLSSFFSRDFLGPFDYTRKRTERHGTNERRAEERTRSRQTHVNKCLIKQSEPAVEAYSKTDRHRQIDEKRGREK